MSNLFDRKTTKLFDDTLNLWKNVAIQSFVKIEKILKQESLQIAMIILISDHKLSQDLKQFNANFSLSLIIEFEEQLVKRLKVMKITSLKFINASLNMKN